MQAWDKIFKIIFWEILKSIIEAQEGDSHPIPLPAFGGVGSTPSAFYLGASRWGFEIVYQKKAVDTAPPQAPYDTRQS